MKNDLMNLMRPHVQKGAANPYTTIQRFPAYNQYTTYGVPSFGLVKVYGTAADGSLIVDGPDADGAAVYANGPNQIPSQQYGIVSKAWPIWAAYDAGSGTPTIGDIWG